MAKIGTAQIELKGVVNKAELDKITEQVAAAFQAGVELGIQRATEEALRKGIRIPL